MLQTLRIENFALIDHLELSFGAGLNVLTGETGAGKSIILDALDALLGGKVTSRIIRSGRQQAMIEGSFVISAAVQHWLADQEIDPLDDQILVCSRELSLQQNTLRSRSRLNGVVVNRQQLDNLRDCLIAITAQGQAIQLGASNRQRQWLDDFGGAPIRQQRQQVGQDYTQFLQAQKALETWQQSERQRLQQLDLLEYQLNELNQVGLQTADEDQQLQQEQHRLNHTVQLQEQSQEAYQALYEQEQGQASTDLLGQALRTLEQMQRIDAQIGPVVELVQEALTQVEEASRLLSDYSSNLEADPQRLGDVQERLAQLKTICRKYGPSLSEALAYHERISHELEHLKAGEASQAKLEKHYRQAQNQLQQSCAQLTALRQTTAQQLEAQLLTELCPLAMEKAQFQAQLIPSNPTAQGAEQIRFCFSPNPGEPLQPLSETASGGEMSRFLLALQACFAQADAATTLIFDEIDVGVSGRVAQAIAEKLCQLSLHHQVLCVTHQPLVAAMADHHFRVSKLVVDLNDTSSQATTKSSRRKTTTATATGSEPNNQRTIVQVELLTDADRLQELAQIAGGRSANQAIAFAEALLAEATSLRQRYQTQKAKLEKAKLEKV
jgi:DNA repair protein RecN (Recombination protein N)